MGSEVGAPRRVLLVKTSSMGDVVHALPVVADLHAAFAGVTVDWLVEEAYAPLVRAHPGVDRVIELALRRWRRSPCAAATRQQWRAMLAQLRGARYDAVIDLQGLVKSAAVARLARGEHVGLSWASAREPLAALFYTRRMRSSRGRTEAAVPRCRELAAWAMRYTPQGAPRYGLQIDADHPDWVGEGAYAVLLSATAKPRKLWDEAHWIELAAALHARGLRSVFAWGSAAERERAQRLQRAVDARCGAGVACLAPQAFALDAWMRVLRAAALVVGVDTGLLYLGAAVGTPAVAIHAGSSPHSVEFESAAPWRCLGDDGAPPSPAAVLDAVRDVLAAEAR
ncbi:lipopolysaccharide heptosyltransferase 1 [mine drainage metagenome]|uniref:Lipopolysaccharide heptosyltransferase 1 n=1 Tax=mine drainage metagenome TaxID=410659 RepID=A0A1J5R6C0_9ZZZZ